MELYKPIRSLFASLLLFGCAPDTQDDLRTTQPVQLRADADSELSGLNLTLDQCSDPAENLLGRVTVSPRAQLYINLPDVLNNERALNSSVGKWSFAYAMREILELPDPGNDPDLLAAEQQAVDSFVSMSTAGREINASKAKLRARTTEALISAWGKTIDSTGAGWRTFRDAPFKLVAIVNRLDIAKKDNKFSAGEGRFVYGFTGPGQMTVILEYDLAIGDASPDRAMKGPVDWANKWQGLKAFLVDTDAKRPGTQPDQRVRGQPQFRDKEGYLAALESITEMWAGRSAKVRLGNGMVGLRAAAISQIRTNEFMNGEIWALREIVRSWDSSGMAILQQATVKNNPDPQVWMRNPVLARWIKTNTRCPSADLRSCAYQTSDGKLPESVVGPGGQNLPLLGAESLADLKNWFPNATNQADRTIKFFELQTCSGCHSNETNSSFTHVSPFNGNPSRFTLAEIPFRMLNFKNLVCLGAASRSSLDLVGEEQLEGRRINMSNATH